MLDPGRGRTKTGRPWVSHLFAGSDGGAGRWAIVCSLITTAKLNNREPYTYFKDVLDRMTNGHPANRINELLPWNWTPST